jgi:hypothetical protein
MTPRASIFARVSATLIAETPSALFVSTSLVGITQAAVGAQGELGLAQRSPLRLHNQHLLEA